MGPIDDILQVLGEVRHIGDTQTRQPVHPPQRFWHYQSKAIFVSHWLKTWLQWKTRPPIRGETLGELQRLSFDFKQGGAVKRYWLLEHEGETKAQLEVIRQTSQPANARGELH